MNNTVYLFIALSTIINFVISENPLQNIGDGDNSKQITPLIFKDNILLSKLHAIATQPTDKSQEHTKQFFVKEQKRKKRSSDSHPAKELSIPHNEIETTHTKHHKTKPKHSGKEENTKRSGRRYCHFKLCNFPS